ncbi:glycine cleavage system H protein 2, mitochondrial-like isoform X1 [Quercus lobata]|uniref:glycine cleavage system H protein 2, mitochondrial-like isoform X1 n=2 Tax=Quercus lobata TaxID=97700 RepID=UPI001248846F|nr:glycine cleavage system H protein 2, mitochondrial-like isoform X1 [Quercus lobata]
MLVLVMNYLKYLDSHEWVKAEGNSTTVGITNHAHNHLGDVVYVELPYVGAPVSQGSSIGVVESVKVTNDINSPISGKVLEVNEELNDSLGTINKSEWNRREKITIFSFSWLTETECLNIVDHLRLGATLEFQYSASQFELPFAFLKVVIPDVLFVYCTCKCPCLFPIDSLPIKGRRYHWAAIACAHMTKDG